MIDEGCILQSTPTKTPAKNCIGPPNFPPTTQPPPSLSSRQNPTLLSQLSPPSTTSDRDSSAAMERSLSIRPRKRKQYSSSTPSSAPFMGRFTRSKAQVHLHRNRSGRSRTDTPSQKSIHQPHLLLDSPLKKPRKVHCEILENGASLELCIKDLRARARRVFSPSTAVVEEGNGDCVVGFDIGEKNCNGSSKMSENCENFELGFEASDPDSGFGPGFLEENKECVDPGSRDPASKEDGVDLNEITSSPMKEKNGVNKVANGNDCCGNKKEGYISSSGMVGPELHPHHPASKEDGVDLNEITSSPMKEKNGVNKVANGNDCCGNKKEGSISSSGMILNSSSRRKVFKSPSLFSYRRLLPFLMDMAKEDSSTSKFEIVDKDFSCKVQKSINVDTDTAKNEDTAEHFDDMKSLDKGHVENVQDQLRVKGQDSHDPNTELSQTEENAGSFSEEINRENGITEGDELIEDCVQTTPPDATIFSEIDIYDARANGEIKILKTGNHVLGNPTKESTCSNHMFVPKKSYRSPTRRSSTISTTKMILNPCSRSKLFKTSSSFSYRRLLPFLMDAAKSSANTDQSPCIQKNLASNQHSVLLTSSDKDAPLHKNEVDKFQEKQETKDHENFPITIKVHSLDGSSDDMHPNLSAPFVSTSSSDGKPNSASSDNISQLDVPNCLHMERTSLDAPVQLSKPVELEVILPIADFRGCYGEAKSSAETECSTINHESLPRESAVEELQHEHVDVGKNCITEGQGYQEGKADMITCVSFKQSSSKTGALSADGTDNSIKGILKRNPRGCRGLCNCLNCASFRLHAERAFEFSRNQMLDAKEVALGLMNELAELRNMLEKPAVDGSSLAALQLNQVREACKKALKTEEQAKRHLNQMAEDLNVHCRITPLQRPRVTFSTYIEEKSIPSRDLSISP